MHNGHNGSPSAPNKELTLEEVLANEAFEVFEHPDVKSLLPKFSEHLESLGARWKLSKKFVAILFGIVLLISAGIKADVNIISVKISDVQDLGLYVLAILSISLFFNAERQIEFGVFRRYLSMLIDRSYGPEEAALKKIEYLGPRQQLERINHVIDGGAWKSDVKESHYFATSLKLLFRINVSCVALLILITLIIVLVHVNTSDEHGVLAKVFVSVLTISAVLYSFLAAQADDIKIPVSGKTR